MFNNKTFKQAIKVMFYNPEYFKYAQRFSNYIKPYATLTNIRLCVFLIIISSFVVGICLIVYLCVSDPKASREFLRPSIVTLRDSIDSSGTVNTSVMNQSSIKIYSIG